jgi:cell division protein FtsL
MAKKSRNRKKSGRRMSIPYPGPLLSILIFAAAVSLGYLWICGRCEVLGRDIGELERERRDLSQQLNLEKARWARNETMDGILRGLARWDIQMSLPDPARVVMVRREALLDEPGSGLSASELAMVAQNGYEQL